MTEWWTYRPSDFLMFSPRTWARLLVAVNDSVAPWQPLLVAAGLVMLWAALHGRGTRAIVVALAAAWAWVAWHFHWTHFASVNTAGPWFAAAWGLQALLLATLGWQEGRDAPSGARVAGLVLASAGLIAYPFLSPLLGRGWRAAEVAGLMPDPTALVTAGLLLALPLRRRAWLLVIPLAWLVVGWTTDWLLYAPMAAGRSG